MEGVTRSDHFMHEQAQAPPIHAEAVSLLQQHLWTHILLCAAEGARDVDRLLVILLDVHVALDYILCSGWACLEESIGDGN